MGILCKDLLPNPASALPRVLASFKSLFMEGRAHEAGAALLVSASVTAALEATGGTLPEWMWTLLFAFDLPPAAPPTIQDDDETKEEGSLTAKALQLSLALAPSLAPVESSSGGDAGSSACGSACMMIGFAL